MDLLYLIVTREDRVSHCTGTRKIEERIGLVSFWVGGGAAVMLLGLQVRSAVPDIHSVIDQAVALASSKSRQQGEPAERGNKKPASASAEQVHTTVTSLDFDASSLAGGVASSALLMVGTA